MRIFATATAAAVVMGRMASAQHILPDVQVPFQGGNIFKRNDIAIGNYTFAYKEPFEPTQYGGFYSWAVNNNTVAGANFTGPHMPNGYDYIPDGSLNVNPYFLINEGSHKPLNTTKLFGNCKDSRDHARDISPGDLDTQCEGKVHKIVHVVFENEVYDWTIADPFWKLLATKGKSLTNFHAITHPPPQLRCHHRW